MHYAFSHFTDKKTEMLVVIVLTQLQGRRNEMLNQTYPTSETWCLVTKLYCNSVAPKPKSQQSKVRKVKDLMSRLLNFHESY